MKINIAAHELSAIMPGHEAEEQPKKILAILWPMQQSIPISPPEKAHYFQVVRQVVVCKKVISQ